MKKGLWLGLILIGFWGCEKTPNTAVFLGGQVVKPSSSFVSVYFGNRVLDTFLLKNSTRFSRKYDSLPPGIYKMEHIPEFTSILLEPADRGLLLFEPYRPPYSQHLDWQLKRELLANRL